MQQVLVPDVEVEIKQMECAWNRLPLHAVLRVTM